MYQEIRPEKLKGNFPSPEQMLRKSNVFKEEKEKELNLSKCEDADGHYTHTQAHTHTHTHRAK